jgi:hypothetical protein
VDARVFSLKLLYVIPYVEHPVSSHCAEVSKYPQQLHQAFSARLFQLVSDGLSPPYALGVPPSPIQQLAIPQQTLPHVVSS